METMTGTGSFVLTLSLLLFGVGAHAAFSLTDLIKNPYASGTSGRIVLQGHSRHGPSSTLFPRHFPSGSRFSSIRLPTSAPRVAPWSPPQCDDPPLVCQEELYRSIDGTCNNLQNPYWGAWGRPQARLLPPQYYDNVEMPRTKDSRGRPLPSPRVVSQAIHTSDSVHRESANLTHFFTVWGQFLDHDITHTPMVKADDGSAVDCCNETLMYPERDFYWRPQRARHQTHHINPECFPITIPRNDRFFRNSCMNFIRSKPFAPTAKCKSETREQGNTQTAYIDASQVYGPTPGEQHALRAFYGGLMKSAEDDLLPSNGTTMCTKRPATADFCFGSGDPRVNEHPMLSSLHIVFHRLHNLLATELALLNPHWDDERLFQESRKIVGAIMQRVTYSEYLPLALGPQAMKTYDLDLDDPYYQYDPNVDATIFNAFSTAAFRYGHSMINGKNSYGFQKLKLRDMFFHPFFVQHEYGNGFRMVLNGLVRDHAQSFDRHMNPDVTDHLFQTKEGRSLDLASLNLQRGRDHALPPFNDFRALCGLPPAQHSREFHGVPFLDVYSDYDSIDLFSGGLSERPVPGGVVGPTFACIIGRQFRNIRLGDRFWYQNMNHKGAFTPEQIQIIEHLRMSHILCLTSRMTAVQLNPFVEPSAENPATDCSEFPPLNLLAWKEV